jgi:protein ImuB
MKKRNKDEIIKQVIPIEPYGERLPCIEPVQTTSGIEIALKKRLDNLCRRLGKQGKGLRNAMLTCYCVDGKILEMKIRTNHASKNAKHLFKLFKTKIASLEPVPVIKLFTLEALMVESLPSVHETFWTINNGLKCGEAGELLNSENKFSNDKMPWYLPGEQYLSECSIKPADPLIDNPVIKLETNNAQPIQVLNPSQYVQVIDSLRLVQGQISDTMIRFPTLVKSDSGSL